MLFAIPIKMTSCGQNQKAYRENMNVTSEAWYNYQIKKAGIYKRLENINDNNT